MRETEFERTEKGRLLTESSYQVTEVAGAAPAGLDDVVGATTVTVARDGREYRLVGTGVADGDVVLFHHKDIGSAADDFLVWSIVVDGDGQLVAHPPVLG